MKHGYVLFVVSLSLIVTAVASSYGQSYSVKGTVTVSGMPVRYAFVTIVDNSDTAFKYYALTDSTGAFDAGMITSVKPATQLPASFQLEQNYPNPFMSETAIAYNLDKQSDVKVTIYDVLGREVKNYSLGYQDVGVHGVIWSGRNNLGQRVAPGVYFYRLRVGSRAEVRKMLFGFGAANAPVSLSGVIPPAPDNAHRANDVIDGPRGYYVMITNTDSTDPLITPQGFGYYAINSDTTFAFSVSKLSPAVVYVDSTQQKIEGFGAANTVNWQAANLTSSDVTTLYDSLAGDAGFTLMRLRIPPDSSQFVWSVPTAKEAESYGAKVFASPWTPPTWMKTNHNIAGGYLDTNEYAAYAAHLAAFADTLANNGAPIYAISIQNEPDANVTYESCYWTATDIFNFMRYDAPKVGIPVFMPESESFTRSFSDSTLNDSLACAHTAFVGGHLYGASPYVYSLALSKGKEVWMTEYLDTATAWSAALGTGRQINDCMYDDMSAYIYWWTKVSWGPLGFDGRITKRGYVMSQFARFVRPGYYRVYATENPQANLYMTAYTGNGKTVLVFVNANSYSVPQTIVLNNDNATSFTPYVTSSSEDCAQGNPVPTSSGGFTVNLAPSSVTTYVSN